MNLDNLQAGRIAAQAAKKAYERLLKFSEFDEKITHLDKISAKCAKNEISYCFTNHDFCDAYFSSNGSDFFITFESLIHGDIKLRYDNNEAILVAQNAVEAFECAQRLKALI